MRPDLAFHAALLAGLVLLVRVMIAGVEAPDAAPVPAGHKLRLRIVPALGGVFLLVTGLVGTIALPAGLPLKPAGALAVLSGLVLAGLARNLILTAASLPLSDHEFDPRYAMQGVPGVVVAPIPTAGQGIVQLPPLHAGAQPPRLAAESVDGSPLDQGTEVAVERIEGDVAFVEAWSAVERRL